jgi:hypothetical protein
MKPHMKFLSILALLSVMLAGCASQSTVQSTPIAEAQHSRLQVAEAMFQERCKKAGEKIHKTVENVEGIFLMKLRPQRKNFSDQFVMDDPYGKDLAGAGYIQTFLKGSYQAETIGTPRLGSPPRIGYQYVEVIDSQDGKRYRYTGSIKEVTHTSSMLVGGDGKTTFKTKDFVLDRLPAPGPAPRYGVTYDDISTREEREYWIAGSSLKVVDLKTNEVIAERIGYMMDRGQGNTSGGRSPWLFAADHACPAFSAKNGSRAQPFQSLDFVEKVLKPQVSK